jgi:anti-sigma factor RsiW
MSDVTQPELLINALLDGQLDAGEAERVSKLIADDDQLSEMLATFTQQRSAIAELPQYKLKDRFADRVLEIAAAEAAGRPMLDRPPSSSVDWKKYAMSLAAIAGLLMGMLVYQWTPISRQDGPTVAVLSSNAKPVGTKDQPASLPALDKINQGSNTQPWTQPSSDEALASVAPQNNVPATTPSPSMASSNASEGMGDGVSSKHFAAGRAKRFSAAPVAALPPAGSFSFSGTPMAAPQNQTQPAIDQVWLLEVNERFSQRQLLTALTSNSISVPPELEQSPAVTLNSNENIQPQDVGGIYVAAKPLQMKNALSQLSQSDAITISAFHLPGETSDSVAAVETDESLVPGKEPSAPLTIVPPQKAIAQKLRGNFFAQQAPKPSSMVPESFDKLEIKMGIAAGKTTATATAEKESGGQKTDSEKADSKKADSEQPDLQVAAQPPSEMEQLFPNSTLESDRLQNFLILIRNKVPAKK